MYIYHACDNMTLIEAIADLHKIWDNVAARRQCPEEYLYKWP